MDIKIETGDNLLVSSKGFLPEAIQWFEDCDWNHSAFFIWLNDILYLIEADKHGIALTKWDDYVKSDKGLLILKPRKKIDDKIKSDMIDFVLEYTGHTPYGFVNLLFYQPIRYITKYLFNKEIWIGRSESKSGKRFICGQWTVFIYDTFFGWFPNWNKLAPVDIYEDINFDHFEWKKVEKILKKAVALKQLTNLR